MLSLQRHTIFLTLAGSQAHGTAREGSDVDLRGVCIAPLSVRLSLFSTFEQHDGPLPDVLAARVLPRLQAHPTASRGLGVKTECVVFDLAKFVRLCAAANPNALEILFADQSDWLLETPAWRRLYGERHHFLTKKVEQTFVGYALAQLAKIERHRAWLLEPPKQKPTRASFGLPETGTLGRDDQNRIEQSLADKLRSYGIDELEMSKPTRIALRERLEAFQRDVASASAEQLDDRMRAVASHSLDLPPSVITTLNAEKRYRAAMKHWEAYQTWKRQRNPARAELEHRFGYDTKHAMHLVRLMRMGLEALERQELIVRRHDAAELDAIRDGALTFDELRATTARLRDDLKQAATRSALPHDVDYEQVDRLARELMTDVHA